MASAVPSPGMGTGRGRGYLRYRSQAAGPDCYPGGAAFYRILAGAQVRRSHSGASKHGAMSVRNTTNLMSGVGVGILGEERIQFCWTKLVEVFAGTKFGQSQKGRCNEFLKSKISAYSLQHHRTAQYSVLLFR